MNNLVHKITWAHCKELLLQHYCRDRELTPGSTGYELVERVLGETEAPSAADEAIGGGCYHFLGVGSFRVQLRSDQRSYNVKVHLTHIAPVQGVTIAELLGRLLPWLQTQRFDVVETELSDEATYRSVEPPWQVCGGIHHPLYTARYQQTPSGHPIYPLQ